MPAPHRLLRAAIATAMATAAGAGAHVLGGGVATAPGVAGAATALLLPIWLLAGRERSFAVIAAVQLAGQQLVHAWLELAGPAHDPLPDDISLYGHLVAAAAIAGWLRTGERRVWAACRRVAQVLVTRCAPYVPAARPRPPAPREVVLDPVGRALRHVLHRRGPPRPA